MELEEHKTSENMKVFFTKLLELKVYVKQQIALKMEQGIHSTSLSEVYSRLDAIIKEKK